MSRRSTVVPLPPLVLRFAWVALGFLPWIAPVVRADCTSFTAPVSYVVGLNPLAVASADFDRNGTADLAVANPSSNTVTILMGLGDGTFAAGVSYAPGLSPVGLIAADLDRDGTIDLAVANRGSNSVTILDGNGFGGFATSNTLEVHTGPVHLATGDLNRDGLLDLAVVNTDSNDVAVLLGTGLGFGAPTHFPVGTQPRSVAIGDFDGNGTPDLVVANHLSNSVSYLSGDGSGGFGTTVPVGIPFGVNSTAITTGDFNGDGHLDMGVSAFAVEGVIVLLGDGTGGFGAPAQYAAQASPHSIATADFDGDGTFDLAVANLAGHSISILSGNGDGTFAEAVHLTVANSPTALTVGDFDRDGKPDIATVHYFNSAAAVMLNRSACFANCGAFGIANELGSSSAGTSIAFGDFNRDGTPDLATGTESGDVSVQAGNGAGGFGVAASHSVGGPVKGVGVADFNGDGFADIATANGTAHNVSILLGNGAGGFGSSSQFPAGTSPSDPRSLVIGDFNRDGRPDIAVACNQSNEIAILLNSAAPGSPTASFSSSAVSAGAGAGEGLQGISAGDFDRDGDLDLAVADYGLGIFGAGSVLIFHGNGNGGFSSFGSIPTLNGATGVAVADFNRDGQLDIAATNSESASVSIAMGSAGWFGSTDHVGVGNGPVALTPVDINGDGRLDLAVANNLGDSVSILLGNGSGGFSSPSPSTYPAGNAPASIAAADLDGDGKADLALATSNLATNVSVLLNDCPAPQLTIQKAHTFLFSQGGAGYYTIDVANAASTPTGGFVTVSDTLPPGLNAVAIGGDGWDCTLDPLVCRRSDPLQGFSSYPQISLNVAVATDAPAQISNTATVLGGGDASSSSSTDVVTVLQSPDLRVTKTHSISFYQGMTGASYTITVANIGGALYSGALSVADTLPAGLTATDFSGNGWTCTLAPLVCTRSDSLAAGNAYPPIILTVNVGGAAASVTNVATLSAGPQSSTANDTANDLTLIAQVPDLTIAMTHAGDFTQGQRGRTYSIAVRNEGFSAASSTSVTGTLPTGLLPVSIRGNGWNCVLATLTCSRTDALPPGSSHPVITLTVDVAANAPPSIVASANVSASGEAYVANNTSSDPTVVNAAAAHCGTFSPPVHYFAGSQTNSVATGDFNGDGTPDLATTNAAWVSILMGNGDGSFGAAADYSAGTVPIGVAVGDFDGDGWLDLAVAGYSSNGVSVLLGLGNGSFEAAVAYPTLGTGPQSPLVADLNGDGKLDLAVPNYNSNDVSILIGHGDGTFAAATRYATAIGPHGIVSGDFNGDGAVDLGINAFGSNVVSVLLGNGAGVFAAAVNHAVGAGPITVAVGDINDDGILDLVSANYTSSNASVLLGQGNGGFAATVNHPLGIGTTSVAIADLNGDGKQDLAVALEVGGVAVLFGTGSGSFAAPVNQPAGSYPVALAVDDLDNDGKPDLAVGSNSSGEVSILLSACADLAITKSHTGNFTQGQTGVTYTVAVSNVGTITNAGAMTVTDQLPVGLIATAIGGTGWTCELTTLSCTRTGVLLPGESYPPIVLTVDVRSNAPSIVTNVATVSGTGDQDPSNSSASDPTTVNASGLIAPTGFMATATSTSQISVVWDSVTTAVSYRLYRRSNNGPFSLIATQAGTAFPDTGLAAGTTYLYRVEAVNGAAAASVPSRIDLATTIFFTDDPLIAGTTVIKAVHLAQLRTAVEAVRTAAGLSNAPYASPGNTGAVIKASDVAELRSRLTEARSALSLPAISYTDPSLAGMVVKAVHLRNLRDGTK